MLMFACGLAVGLVARGRPARPAPELPPIDFTGPVTVSRLHPPGPEVIKLRPYAVTVDGRNCTREPGGVPDEPWLIHLDGGRMQLSCALEERH
ncbi:hypothetical protein C1280_27310 [Gemmata obscuriglobus]|uniref:Uncharacterized protein n=1 Tax=Gemmata obscuriglobus TaxID=114 RepID=A0A2Z3HBJ8_9BACT|nr:hypothetical protein C1280_27310 [Gemmata obscuriglobus]